MWKDIYTGWLEDDLATKGKGAYSAHANGVNFLGLDVSPTVIM